jgi:hypothetical protein
MKKYLLVSLLVMVSSLAMAQREAGKFSIIPRVGVTLANLSGDAIYTSSSMSDALEFKSRYKAGLVCGVDFDYQLSQQLSLSLGAAYSQQGCRYGNDKTQTSVDGKVYNYLGFSNASTQLHYLNIPLMANFYLTDNFAVKAGVQVGFNLSGKLKYSETPYSVNEDGDVVYEKQIDYNLDTDSKKVDISIPVGVSYEYENVIIDARYNIGLTRTSEIEDIKGPKNQVFQFTVGYRFTL